MSTSRHNEIGRYRLIAEIDRGGMGIVYLGAIHGPGGFNKLVVIKELKPELAADQSFLMMFLDEARIAARLNHPNIVQTNEVGNEGDRYFIAMDYLDGKTLHHVLRRLLPAKAFPIALHLRVMAEMLAGLQYAHELTDFSGGAINMIHRDISPHNVFITYDGQVKIVDFGIAKATDSSQQTQAGVFKGKVAYMAPEQAAGERIDRRVDIFAAGVMLWEAIVGRRLWAGKSDMEILSALVRRQPIPTPISVDPTVPEELNRICERAMAWDPADRYAWASEMQADIEAYLATLGANSTTREVGRLVSQSFASDRARLKSVIESHVASMNAAADNASATLPVLPGAGTGVATTGTLSRQHGVDLVAMNAQAGNLEWQTASGPTFSRSTTAVVSGEVRPDATKRGILGAVASGVALGAVALAGVLALTRKPPRAEPAVETRAAVVAPASTEARPPVAPAPVAAPASASEMIDITIRATPSSAQVWVDDVATAGNPVRMTFPKGGPVHRVRVAAHGYVTKNEEVRADSNVSLTLALERQPVGAYVRPSQGRSQNDGGEPGTGASTTRTRPSRPIDTASPYSE